MAITNGGTAVLSSATFGESVGSSGALTVDGATSLFQTTVRLVIGENGAGTATVTGGATLNAGTITLASSAGSSGTLNIGAGAGNPAVAPGTLDTPSIIFGAGTGTINFNHTSANYVFAPAISGNGRVNVLAGTTILTADNTYSGGTTITAGTLQLGNGGTTGSIVGDVVDNGTLVFNRSASFAFGGVISGTGSVSQIGTGTTFLTGSNTYAGGTNLNGGILAVRATLTWEAGRSTLTAAR